MGARIVHPNCYPETQDTQLSTLEKILQCGTGGSGEAAGGGGGIGEIVRYTTTGPTADGVTPNNQNGEAIAVKPGSTTFTWDSTLHVWDDV